MLRDEAVSPACVHTAQLQQLWENDAQSQHQAILELKLQSCNTREQLTNVKRRLSELVCIAPSNARLSPREPGISLSPSDR